ncbi:MAG: phage tail tube protein [Myxococcota bacterium]
MKLTGISFVTVNGIGRLRVKEDSVDFNSGGAERTDHYANQEFAGFTEKTVGATLSLTILHASDVDQVAIRDYVDGEITFETDTGVVWSIPNAYCKTPPDLSVAEAELTTEFGGGVATRVA